MQPELKEIKDRIKNIKNVATFEELLSCLLISEEDRTILRMIYKDKKTVGFIADTLGYSEATIKRKHKSCLRLIALNINDIT